MTIRSRRETVTFRHSFPIRGVERLLPAGAYEVIADQETIESETFLPTAASSRPSWCPRKARASMETLSIGSVDLANVQAADECLQ
jgi:hypothetical protein